MGTLDLNEDKNTEGGKELEEMTPDERAAAEKERVEEAGDETLANPTELAGGQAGTEGGDITPSSAR